MQSHEEMTDTSEQVTLRWIDGELDAVVVHNNWRRYLTPDELGNAVVEILTRRLPDVNVSFDDSAAIIVDAPGAEDMQLDPLHALAIMNELSELNKKIFRDLDQAVADIAQRQQATPSPDTPPAFVSSNSRVTIHGQGAFIGSISFDPSWVEKAPAATISEALFSALEEYGAQPTPAAPPLPASFQDNNRRLDAIFSEVGLTRVQEDS